MTDSIREEARILDWVRMVCEGQRIEDERVDAKATWPTDHGRAARQLGAMANASQGDRVYVIVGLDEDGGSVVEPEDVDPDVWWRQVERYFDERVAPDLVWHQVVVTDWGPVVGLSFGTSRRPYVVKNYSGAGHIEREVPWRTATGTRSASRHNLIQLLDPQGRPPEVTAINGSSCVVKYRRPEGVFQINARVLLLMKLANSQSVTLLSDGITGSLSLYESPQDEPYDIWELPAWSFGGVTGEIDPGVMVSVDGRYLTLDRTAVVRLHGDSWSREFGAELGPEDLLQRTHAVSVETSIRFADPDTEVRSIVSPRLTGAEMAHPALRRYES